MRVSRFVASAAGGRAWPQVADAADVILSTISGRDSLTTYAAGTAIGSLLKMNFSGNE